MDKKNTVIGVLLIAAAFVAMISSPKPVPPPPEAHPPVPTSAATPATASATAGTMAAAAAPAQAAGAPATVNPSNAAFAAVANDAAGATVTTLANDFIAVRFTNFGGAIREVALQKRDHSDHLIYAAHVGGTEPFIFNALHADPMLAFVDLPGLDRQVRFEIVSQTADDIVYRAVLDNRIEVTRHFTLAPNQGGTTDPYQLRHETTFRNLTDQIVPLPRVALSIGTAAPVNERDLGDQLTTGYSNGKDQTFISRRGLEASSGMFGLGASEQKPFVASPGPAVWTTVGNQFFTTILTPDEPAAGLVTRRVKLLSELPDDNRSAYGLAGAAQFDLQPLAPHGTTTLAASFYVGPKEYRRLANAAIFKADQDKVMQYAPNFFNRIFFSGFCAPLLITLMGWMHAMVPNWGVALILTTLSLKLVFLPLTIKASRSMKRMAKLQPFMVAIREKYKDNPAKQHAATIDLYKEHKVNPMGGCLPMLIPMPFFIAFFTMLRSTAELRYASFLWVPDLASTDTVGHIFGISINVLPLLLTALTVVQMRLTPTPNADPAQAKMMQFMPLVFLFIYYSMPAALSLYSTANALFTIVQQVIINRLKEPDDAIVAAGPGGKPVKNVTPSKKK